MIDYTIHDIDTGEIVLAGTFTPDTMQLHAARADWGFILGTAASRDTHYVADGALVAYTDTELAARAAMGPGWKWQMPERIAVDQRDANTRDADDVRRIDKQRRAAYPPVENLADAMYWQSKGDSKPISDYFAAIAAVKARFPKKEN